MVGYLSKDEYVMVSDFIDRLKDRLHDKLVRVLLYGSKARGDYNDDSDIDLIIVVKGKEDEDAVPDVLFEIQCAYEKGYLISPLWYNEKDFKENMAEQPINLFYRNIVKDYIEVTI